jgi:ribosomal-protein-alanine N-acetyltransferase
MVVAHSAPAVTLRPARVSDAALFRSWRGEPSVRRHQPLRDVPLAQIRNDLASQHMQDLYRGRGERFQWVVEVDRRPAGWITLVVGNWEHGLCEVGFALTSSRQSQGVMTQALGQLVPDLFERTRLERIEARCAVDNHASRRVLEKSGFRHEGVLRGYFLLHGRRVDHHLYARLREDPEAFDDEPGPGPKELDR